MTNASQDPPRATHRWCKLTVVRYYYLQSEWSLRGSALGFNFEPFSDQQHAVLLQFIVCTSVHTFSTKEAVALIF